MERLEKITLHRVLPRVFAVEEPSLFSESDVWLTDLAFERGNRYLVSADSGTGKSSLCSFIYGYRNDYSGEILFDGRDVSTFSSNEWAMLRRNSLAYLPQEMALFPELTLMENIMLKNNLTHFRDMRWIDDALQLLEIDCKRNQLAAKLSIGQQQRVAIVRALCQPFDFILLDEPVSHLDMRRAEVAAALIQSEADAQGAAVIATSVGNDLVMSNPIIKKL